MENKKREKRCADLWLDIDFDIDVSQKYYGPSETNSFFDPQNPNAGYVVRGVGPVYHKVTNPECDAY